MKKLTNLHAKSLDRAISILGIAMDRQSVPKYKKEFARDINRLREILDHIEFEISNPEFSMLQDTACPLTV